MRRFISTVLILVMVFGLAACGGKETQENPPAESSENTQSEEANAEKTDYPTKTITLYCGYSAGGGSDVICRVLSEKLTKYLGQTVIVENVTGSGGWVLWSQMFAEKNPDGYSIYLVNTPNYNLGAYDLANPREYTYEDADLLCNWVSDYNAIGIRKDETRYTDWDSFVAYWKENPLVSSASAVGVMSDDATLVDRLCNYYKTEVSMLQTNGASDNQAMLLSGSTDFMVGNVSEMANAHLNGEYKLICVFAPERDKFVSDVPTFKELTGEEMIGDSSRGFALPKGVDPAIREIIMEALRETINDPETMKQMDSIYTPVNYVEGDAYYELMQNRLEAALKAYGREGELKK
uniref:tripartite tricarboxylate transporter substrate-binding protein n=1 Tax=Ndongobacter massiliensis TaxID=1871025 RepID=UPI0009316EF6|nr:tripartite tricarboxylate transporter substrate-binding protein [Ndongobacter massiliensis]